MAYIEPIAYKKRLNFRKICLILIILLIVVGAVGFFGRGKIREAYLDYKFQKIHDSLPPAETAQQVITKNLSVTSTSSTLSTTSSVKLSLTPTSTKLEPKPPLVTSSTSSTVSIPTISSTLAIEMNLKVPFTTQAPFRDW